MDILSENVFTPKDNQIVSRSQQIDNWTIRWGSLLAEGWLGEARAAKWGSSLFLKVN